MQLAEQQSRRRQPRQKGAMGRAIAYLGRYSRLTTMAVIALIIATAAQLAVPQLVQNIIDTIIDNAINKAILDIPAQFQQVAAEQFGLDLTAAQAALDSAPRAIVSAGLIVVLFAVARGCLPLPKPIGRKPSRKTLLLNCVTICTQKSSGLALATTTKTAPASS